jgi:UDP-glucose 4-epimerase
MHVLITGAGLAGCHLAAALQQRGHEAILYDVAPRERYIQNVAGQVPVVRGDIRDLAGLIETMQGHAIEAVVHTAFLIGGALAHHPYSGVRTNVDGALATFEAARLTGVKRFLFASTQGVYDYSRADRPIPEDHPLSEVDGYYRASKIACERLLRAFAAQSHLDFAILRFAQIYGYGHYAAGDLAGPVMHAVLVDALADRPVRIDPGVLSVNDYVYAKDVAQGAALACEKRLRSGIYNIGSGFLGTTTAVAEAIRHVAPAASVEILSEPAAGPFWAHEQPLDIARAREDLGYQPQYDLAAGIEDFAKQLRDFAARD